MSRPGWLCLFSLAALWLTGCRLDPCNSCSNPCNSCGDLYVDEWLSDPPPCNDPCNSCNDPCGCHRPIGFISTLWRGARRHSGGGCCDSCAARPNYVEIHEQPAEVGHGKLVPPAEPGAKPISARSGRPPVRRGPVAYSSRLRRGRVEQVSTRREP